MARSYKKVAGGGFTTAPSDKEFKVYEHRRFRRKIRTLITSGQIDLFPNYEGAYGDPYSSPKDGKVVWYWSARSYIIRRRVYIEQPATMGDWKKLTSK